MAFHFGTYETPIGEKYINNVKCPHCGNDKGLRTIFFCKTFSTGIFYPLKWWGWQKKAQVQCPECGKTNVYDTKNPSIPPKVFNYLRETKIPFHFYLPSLLSIFTVITIGSLVLLGFFSGLINAFTPLKNKVAGQWHDEDNTAILNIYKDNSYTYISRDTIIFGNYQENSGTITLPFEGTDYALNKHNINPIQITPANSVPLSFIKYEDKESDELFRKEFNSWRVAPAHKETNEQIRTRVLSYLNFETKKFQKALDDGDDYIRDDPYAPIIFANNGFGIRQSTLENWRYIFFDEDDWYKANKILEEEFPNELLDDLEENNFKRSITFLNLYSKKIKSSSLDHLNKKELP